MRIIIAGLGVQGYKRKLYAGSDYIASVDPINSEAEYKQIEDVPLKNYDSVIVCVPDKEKYSVIKYSISNEKNVLVEKPLWTSTSTEISQLQEIAQKKNLICYTAYNHRFEPHFIRMHDLIKSNELGKIYSCRMFYGNGTAKLVKDSIWRDKGTGVLHDLGSHLLDTCLYWFGKLDKFCLNSLHCHENISPDHAIISSEKNIPRIELEMTLCMWRNHFTCDVIAEKGSAHIESLCKWGPSTFTHRKRIFPSGRPFEKSVRLIQEDPTWNLEYDHFKNLVLNKHKTDLTKDIWIQSTLNEFSE